MIGMATKKNPWGARLRKLRQSKSLTQQEVADLIEVGVSTYRNWEQGRTAPPAYARKLVETSIKNHGQ